MYGHPEAQENQDRNPWNKTASHPGCGTLNIFGALNCLRTWSHVLPPSPSLGYLLVPRQYTVQSYLLSKELSDTLLPAHPRLC